MELHTKAFQRRKEDFKCESCGFETNGNGYTNHCPQCLFSKHVDVNPGDRAATCGGLMAPRSIETKKGEFVIIHECLICGFTRRNRVQSQDEMEAVIRISRTTATDKAKQVPRHGLGNNAS